MKTRDHNQDIWRVGALFLLWIMSGYFGAHYAVKHWLPAYPAGFFIGLLIFLIASPLTHYLLRKRWRYTGDMPYLVLPFDFLIPWSLYPSLLMICFFVLPRYGLWAYGAIGNATILSVRTIPAFDGDLHTMPGTCVDYVYNIHDSHYEKTACSGGQPFKEGAPDDFLHVTYFRLAPQFASLKLSELYRLLDGLVVWWAWIVGGWMAGTAVISPKRYPPPPPAPPQTSLELLERYDLVALLTKEDDPTLWSAVIHTHFPMPENGKIFVPGLRFGIGEIQPVSKYLLQPIVGTCFERADKYHLMRTPCPSEEQGDHHFDSDLASRLDMRLIHIGQPPYPQQPTLSIVVPRPSANDVKVPVYTAVNHVGAAATGATYYWIRTEAGIWEKSNQQVNWWYEG